MEALRAAAVSRSYFLDGKTKSEIAADFSISRFKVAKILDWAQQVGIARVEISAPQAFDLEVGTELERRFGIETAVVVDGGADGAREAGAQLGPIVASVITEALEPLDVLGVGWGRTLDAAADALTQSGLPSCPVVQLIGATDTTELSTSPGDVVRRFAEKTGGPALRLHAPFFVADAVVAQNLRREPLIERTLNSFPKVTKAVLGLGSWTPPDSGFMQSIGASDRDLLAKRGAVADICAILLDEHGLPIDPPVEERTIAMSEGQLRQVPMTIVAAAGREKARAILAVLHSKLPTVLITNSAAAHAVLELAARDSS